jgi:hypothetical protein
LSRDGLTATSSIIKAIPEPKFTPGTLEFLRPQDTSKPLEIVLNTTYRLEGWYLAAPSGVDGLTYEFWPTPFNEPIPPTMGIKFKMLNHTANLIEFRFEFVGELPSNYENTVLFGDGTGTPYHLIYVVKYGGKSITFIQKPYVLRVQ